MFARFRNFFSKNKIETETGGGTGADLLAAGAIENVETSANVIAASEAPVKLEGLNFLKSLVAKEQPTCASQEATHTRNSLSDEVAEMLKERILKNEARDKQVVANEVQFRSTQNQEKMPQHGLALNLAQQNENVEALENSLVRNEQPEIITNMQNEIIQRSEKTNSCETYLTKEAIEFDFCENKNKIGSHATSDIMLESLKSLSPSTAGKNNADSTLESFDHLSEFNPCNNSSIVVDDLPSEITTPSPTVESTMSCGSSSNTSTLESPHTNEVLDPSKIVINPINSNGLACNAITNKLSDIAEVAESLDAVIRDVQENVQLNEFESSTSPSHKKLATLRSTSSEDWHSRSTEDDSFATASEGNFTPSSSSFQTASGRTSSFISCDKNSYDASEADDSTFAFEMPELVSPLNMSFEGSEQSFLSAQPLNNLSAQEEQKLSNKLSYDPNTLEEDQHSTADIEQLHSESLTPTPEEHCDTYHNESIPIESDTELEVAAIADAPSMEILTEHVIMPMSRTPEVSPSNTNTNSNQNTITTHITVNLSRDSNDQQEQQNNNSTNSNNNSNNIKPNAAWRRSKYYENITKQTIKGFL